MNALTDDAVRRALQLAPTGLFVANTFRPAAGDAEFDVIDPATGAVLTRIADASVADALEALGVADATQTGWAATPPQQRSDILRRAYELVRGRRDDLALLMTLEMGKPLGESLAEVDYSADFLRWFSEEAVRIGGSVGVAPDGGSRMMTVRMPVGPCLLVTPWNFPLAMGTRKIGPALAAGCTAIVKPATHTPLTMNALAGILHEAGLPAGVLSVLPTSDSEGVVAALMRDPRLRKLSFTGSTTVGRQLIRQSADQVLRLSMELGGNAPLIVCADADIPRAADEAMKAKLRNNGEACTAANVFFVHENVSAAFARALCDRFDALVVGAGKDATSDVGPLIDERAVERINALVGEAVADGAQVLSRIDPPAGTGGSYLAPTALIDVPPGARIVREEIFGPVAPIVSWADDAELLALLDANEFGLAAYIFTADLDRALALATRLQVGMVGINRGVLSNVAAPFGGVKHSGYGREGGATGIDEYLQTTYVAIDGGW